MSYCTFFFVPNIENPMVLHTHGTFPFRLATSKGEKLHKAQGHLLGSTDLTTVGVTAQRVSSKCLLNKCMSELRINCNHKNSRFLSTSVQNMLMPSFTPVACMNRVCVAWFGKEWVF